MYICCVQQETSSTISSYSSSDQTARFKRQVIRMCECCSIWISIDPANFVGIYQNDGPGWPPSSHTACTFEC